MFQRVNTHLWKKELGGKNNSLHILKTKKEYGKVCIDYSNLVPNVLLCVQDFTHGFNRRCISLVHRNDLSFLFLCFCDIVNPFK